MPDPNIAMMGLVPVLPTGVAVPFNQLTIAESLVATTQLRVLQDDSYPNTTGYPTLKDYLIAEYASGRVFESFNQTAIVTGDPPNPAPPLLNLTARTGTINGSNVQAADGDQVVSWQDQSQYGNVFITVSGGPVFTAAGDEGYPGVYFAGSDSMAFVDASANSPLNLTGDFTIQIAAHIITTGGSAGVIGKKHSDGDDGWQFYQDTNVPNQINARIDAQNNLESGGDTTVGLQVYTFVKAGDVGTWFINGTQTATGAVPATINASDAQVYLGYAETWGGYIQMILYDVVIYGVALTNNQRATQDAYLRTRNGI